MSSQLSLVWAFGQIKHNPSVNDGAPYIHRTDIAVLDVLELLEQGLDAREIMTSLPQLRQKDIDACKAYQARFMSDALARTVDKKAQPMFLLDENISYLMLPDIVRIFDEGMSTHVLAEGLCNERNDDEKDILAHAIEHRYKAILSIDNDFKQISMKRRHRVPGLYGRFHDRDEHMPLIVAVPGNHCRYELARLLEKHAEVLREMMEQKNIFVVHMTPSGPVLPPYAPLNGGQDPEKTSLLRIAP